MDECEKLELTLSILLLISEVLPFVFGKDSCNGILNTIFCMLKKNDECRQIPDHISVATIAEIPDVYPTAPPFEEEENNV